MRIAWLLAILALAPLAGGRTPPKDVSRRRAKAGVVRPVERPVKPPAPPPEPVPDRAEQEEAEALRAAFLRVDDCLRAHDADCLDRQIPFLAGLAAGVHGTIGDLPGAALLPAFARYAAGDLAGAQALAAEISDPESIPFRSLIRAKLRRRFARQWIGWVSGLYGAILLAGLYCGVRQIRAQRFEAAHG